VRKPITLAFLGLGMVVLIAGLMSLRVIRRGFSTHDEPSAIEVFAARTMRSWSVPSDLRGADNPLPLSDAVLSEARAHWADHCASCHGNDGKGKTVLGERMFPPAPDMTLAATQDQSDGELFAVIENGIRLTGMPGWGDGTAQSAYGSWSLVHFIRRLPTLTTEEIAEMEALNPKSPEEWEQIQAERAFLEGGSLPPAAAGGHGSSPHQH
jgi:cytochrome c553